MTLESIFGIQREEDGGYGCALTKTNAGESGAVNRKCPRRLVENWASEPRESWKSGLVIIAALLIKRWSGRSDVRKVDTRISRGIASTERSKRVVVTFSEVWVLTITIGSAD
jgi:hypothetical protein